MAALPAAPDNPNLPVPAGMPGGLPAVPGAPGMPGMPGMPAPTTPEGIAATLSGREKAATLLVSLGPEQAAEILQHLPAEEIEALSLEMAKLRTVDPNKANAVLSEFVHMADA